MALGCGAKFLKYCLFGFNLIFVIAGMVCLGVGIWLIADDRAIDSIDTAMQDIKVNVHDAATSYKGMPNGVRTLGIILACVGGTMLLVAFLGCCGAVKEWRPMLVCYAIFLVGILAVELALAIYAAVNRTSFENDVKNYFAETLRAYGGNDSYPGPVRASWDMVMNKSQCCGVDSNYTDGHRGFHSSSWYAELKEKCPAVASTPDPYPLYCCTSKITTIQLCEGYQHCLGNQIHQAGCYDKFRDALQNKFSVIIGVGVTVGLIQLIGIIFACCLCCAVSQEASG